MAAQAVKKTVIIRRTGAIGDALAATIVAQRLALLDYQVIFQAHPNCHSVLKRCPSISKVTSPEGLCQVNLDGAYEKTPLKANTHFYLLFLAAAINQLNLPTAFQITKEDRPRLTVNQTNAMAFRSGRMGLPRPWIFICPRSEAYNVRQVPDPLWCQTAERTPGTKFWLGIHPAPPGIVDCKLRDLDVMIDVLSTGDMLLTVDTGPAQIAAALKIPIVAIKQAVDPALRLPWNSFKSVSADLECLNCQKNLCPKNQYFPPCQNVDPEEIAQAARELLKTLPMPTF